MSEVKLSDDEISYNQYVINRIRFESYKLDINDKRFCPEDFSACAMHPGILDIIMGAKLLLFSI